MEQRLDNTTPAGPNGGIDELGRHILDAVNSCLGNAWAFMKRPDPADGSVDEAAEDLTLAVALSGGADSTALLKALVETGRHVEALHCNFELRGSESDADEAACRRLCRSLNVPLTVKHFRTKAYAQRHGVSIEMAARELRYGWFAEVVRQHGHCALCVAHHRDDNIETMLMNLVRGTGLRGLTGMRPVMRRQDGLIVVRPLLEVSRIEIESWLDSQGMDWQTDSTNLRADAAQRNAVRLELLPLLERMNPKVRETLAATASRLAEAQALCDDALERLREQVAVTDGRGGMSIDINALRQTAAPQTVLFELLSPGGFGSEQVADIFMHLDGTPGRVWHSKSGARLLRDRTRLLLEAAGAAASAASGGAVQSSEVIIPLEGRVEWGGVSLSVRRQPVDDAFAIPRDAAVACFDLQRLSLPLTMRRVRSGDRFRPFGMEGTRLVSDLLTDAKVSLFERERQLVVCSGDDIVWVVGRRVAAGCEVSATTRHAMLITLER